MNEISIEGDMDDALDELKRIEESLTRKEINKIQRKNAKPMLKDMQSNSPSKHLPKVTKITTRQGKRPRAPEIGIRIGVINNDPENFPDFSAPALASVLEYGTDERFRKAAKSFGISIGSQSTGSVSPSPWIRPAYDKNEKAFIAKTIRDYEKQVNG